MTPVAFDMFLSQLLADCQCVLESKGADYASKADRLDNFKQAANDVGLAPLEVWSVYFLKHIAAIKAYLRDGEVQSEPIRQRFIDAINYLILGLALIEEKQAPDVQSKLPEVNLATKPDVAFQEAGRRAEFEKSRGIRPQGL